MWMVRAFWRLFGVFTVDLSHNRCQYVYSVLLMATCVYNLITGPETVCKLDQWCVIFSSTLLGMYDRALACITLVSRAAIVCSGRRYTRRYTAVIGSFDAYSPASPAETKRYETFSSVVVCLCLAMIVPINVCRLYYLYYHENKFDGMLLVYYVFMYAQNLSMCCVETQFASQCFVVYTKFRQINGDLHALKNEHVDHATYPFVLGSSWCGGTVQWNEYSSTEVPQRQCARYDNKDFYRPRSAGHPVANAVETLRIKHWMTRQAVNMLNGLFGLHMGLSVVLLWAMALFDIYYEIFQKVPSTIWLSCWLSQYLLRLFMIILISHYTTKQALKSKSLITDINNEILDNSIKEELQLFINQINSSSAEFSAYDFFTLNIQVIKSVMAAGATFLVILVQLHNIIH